MKLLCNVLVIDADVSTHARIGKHENAYFLSIQRRCNIGRIVWTPSAVVSSHIDPFASAVHHQHNGRK